MLAPNTLLQNRYLIVRAIGQGGMGAVYLAKDQRLGHTVALKETFFNDPRLRRAFEREARLLAGLRHPALPVVSDYFAEGDGEFLVMQFIPGDDLEMKLQLRGQPFPVAEVLDWADQLLSALAYLHGQEPPILHRDIKHSNLKLTGDGQIVLLDFGLAKGSVGMMTSVASRSVLGFTPNFAPLEQIQGAGTNERSDLYALAATLYNLLTGQVPADALARASALVSRQPDPLRPADELNREVPEAVAAVLHQALLLNRDDRPESAAKMRRELRAIDTTQEEAARPSQPVPLSATQLDLPPSGALTQKITQAPVSPLPPTQPAALPPTVASPQNDIGADVPGSTARSKNEANAPTTHPATFTNAGGIEFVKIPAGSFMMGSNDGGESERPAHQVTIGSSFYMSKYVVTQAQWQQLIGSNPSGFRGDNLPVENVSWHGAQELIKRLNAANDGYRYRLPSEAEWEYACRAGTTGDYAGNLDAMAWYSANSNDTTQSVGTKQPNALRFRFIRHARECMGVVSRLLA